MTATTAPVIFHLTETDAIDAASTFTGPLSACKTHAADAGKTFFARRADDGRILLRVSPGSVQRLWEQRATEGGKIIERTIQPLRIRLVTRAFDASVADVDLLSDKNFHSTAQQRAIKKAGIKIPKFGGSVEVTAAQRGALVEALRAEGFAVTDHHGAEVPG